MKLIDWILVVVIAITAAFLGYRLLGPKIAADTDSITTSETLSGAPGTIAPIGNLGPESTPPPLVASTPPPTNRPAQVTQSINALSRLKSLTPEQWDSLKAADGIGGRAVSETEGCAMKTRLRGALSLFVRQQALRVGRNDLNLNLGFRGPACFKVGTNLDVLSFDAELAFPIVENLGMVRIAEIISVPARSIEALLRLVDLPQATYEFLLESYYKSNMTNDEFILRLEPAGTSSARSDIPPKTFPNVRILTLDEAQAAVRNKKAVIVDVRTAEEFRRSNIPGSVNVPYSLPAGLSEEYTPGVPKSKLLKSSFDQTQIMRIDPNLQVIVIGRSSKDARPHFALYDIYRLGLGSIGWVYEGMASNASAPRQ